MPYDAALISEFVGVDMSCFLSFRSSLLKFARPFLYFFLQMFYSHVLMSKKGPLAKIWIAAHFERKLNRTQVLQTDIKTSAGEYKYLLRCVFAEMSFDYHRDCPCLRMDFFFVAVTAIVIFVPFCLQRLKNNNNLNLSISRLPNLPFPRITPITL